MAITFYFIYDYVSNFFSFLNIDGRYSGLIKS